MKKPNKKEMKALLHEIDTAGELQLKRHEADIAYENQRLKVIALLKKQKIENAIVQASHYEAEYVFDTHRFIDPNLFLAKVTDRMIRSLCLKVVLKSADVVLGQISPALLNSLVELRTNLEATLHIKPRR